MPHLEEQQLSLRELREAAGIGVNALAREIHADKGAVSRWERGIVDSFDARFVYEMSKTLRCTMEQVYLSFRKSRALYLAAQQHRNQESASSPEPTPVTRKKSAKSSSAVA